MNRRVVRLAMGAVVAAALGVGGFSYYGTAHAASGNCICPQVYAPVKCSNGVTYPNACVASCHHAKNCVPTGDI